MITFASDWSGGHFGFVGKIFIKERLEFGHNCTRWPGWEIVV